MENSQNVELEAAKFLHKLIQESKDEPTKLATKLYVILQHMRSSGKENSMPYQVMSRAMETVIKQHNLDIEALMSSRLPMASGTQIGDSTSLQLAGGAPGSYPASESTDPITFGSSSHDNRSFAANINKDRNMEVFQATPSADLAAGKSCAGKPFNHGGTSTLVNAKKIVQIVSKMLSRTAQIHLVSSHPEVYDPCDDSFALVDALLADRPNLLEHRPSICMEIGCGSGYVITSLALMLGKDTPGCHFIATDINPYAVEVTRKTMEAHECHVELVATDIASGLEARLAGLVDVMAVNPPYVPTPEDEVGQSGITSSWAGGENGRSVIDKILPVADKLLSDKGWLYLLTLTANNPSEICLQMRKKGYASRIVLQRSTEEESLHVIKFWRDLDIQMEESETTGLNRTEHGMLWNSLLSRVSRLPFWSDENHCSQ